MSSYLRLEKAVEKPENLYKATSNSCIRYQIDLAYWLKWQNKACEHCLAQVLSELHHLKSLVNYFKVLSIKEGNRMNRSYLWCYSFATEKDTIHKATNQHVVTEDGLHLVFQYTQLRTKEGLVKHSRDSYEVH